MPSKSSPDVEACLAELKRTLAIASSLPKNLQLIYGRATARQFETCLLDKETNPEHLR